MIRIAYDDNLGLPGGYAEALGNLSLDGKPMRFDCVSFHDVGAMIRAFDRREYAMAFTPAGSLPYACKPFDVIAEASFGSSHATALRSVLQTRLIDSPTTLRELSYRRIGCVNRYCTTSFWAPMILLLEKEMPFNTTIDFVELRGFDDLLAALGDYRIDGAMIWDAITISNPSESTTTRAGEFLNDLPAPVLIANELLGDDALAKVRELASHYQNERGKGLFNGFSMPNEQRLKKFRNGMMRAREVFGLAIPQ